MMAQGTQQYGAARRLFRSPDAMVVKVTVGTARVKERSSTSYLEALQEKIEKKLSSTSLGHPKEERENEGGRKRERERSRSSAVISAGKWPQKGRSGGEKRLPREACVW